MRLLKPTPLVSMHTSVTKKPHAQSVLSGTLSVQDIDAHFATALDRFAKEIELPGFRKGKVPKERVLEEVGPLSVWRAAAESALRDHLQKILESNSLMPIMPPEVSLEITAAQQEVPFTITVTTPPRVDIPEPSTIATDALKKLEAMDREKELAAATRSLEAQTRAMLQVTEERALTDDESKKLGFENATALAHFIAGEAEKAVESYDDQRKRGAVAQALVSAATHDVPLILVEEEVRAMLESSKKRMAAEGLPFNEYLSKRGRTEADILEEMRPQAEKRLILDLIFAQIAKTTELKPDDAEVHRVAHALQAQGVPDHAAHQYAAEVSIREQVWVTLGVAKPKPKTSDEATPEAHAHDHSDPHHAH